MIWFDLLATQYSNEPRPRRAVEAGDMIPTRPGPVCLLSAICRGRGMPYRIVCGPLKGQCLARELNGSRHWQLSQPSVRDEIVSGNHDFFLFFSPSFSSFLISTSKIICLEISFSRPVVVICREGAVPSLLPWKTDKPSRSRVINGLANQRPASATSPRRSPT